MHSVRTPRPANLAPTSHDPGMVRLLALVLGLEYPLPVFATASFSSWFPPGSAPVWPPASDASALLLVDTRDARVLADPVLRSHAHGSSVLFVLAGKGPPGSFIRKALRRIRRPGTQRQTEPSVHALLRDVAGSRSIHRLAFDDGLNLPDAFRTGHAASTGAAFVVGDGSLFEGYPWRMLRRLLGDPAATPREIHLRARGAAVAIMDTSRGNAVVRMVPPGALQDVVERNHVLLQDLRSRLSSDQEILSLMPEPWFCERTDGVLLLGESWVPGVLAWKVARDAHGAAIRRNAHLFLDALRTASTRSVRFDAVRLEELQAPDRAMWARSPFVADDIRRMLESEFESARQMLDGRELKLHASHGDFGFGNVLVEPSTGRITGVIDWDTARLDDFPGIDRVNLEIQILRARRSFSNAVRAAWVDRLASDALGNSGDVARALFGMAVVRYVTRAMSYPELYGPAESEFRHALRWLAESLRL